MAAQRTIPTLELMEMTGMSRPRLSDLVARGIIPKAERGRFPHPEAIRSYCEFMSRQASGRSESDLSKARTALALAQKEAIELKNRSLQDEWVLTKDVNRRWIEMCITFRKRMLGVVNELPHFLSHLTRHDLEVIDRVIRDALTALADEAEAEEGTT